MANNFLAGSAIVRLVWSFTTEVGFNVLGAIKPAGLTISQSTADALGTSIKSAFTANLASLMPTTTQLVKVGVRDFSQPNMPEFLDTLAAVAGVDTTPALPGNVACCVTLRTAGAGKSNRGRVYLGGWSELANEAGGQQSTAVNVQALAFIEAVDNALEAVTMDLAVLSRPADRVRVVETRFLPTGETEERTISDNGPRAGAIRAVTTTTIRNGSWESQRRRANGRGAGALALFTPLASRSLV